MFAVTEGTWQPLLVSPNEMYLWFMSGFFFFLPKTNSYYFLLSHHLAFFKQKLICLYDFDLQDAHETWSKYLLFITQNRNLITCFISSWYLSLTSPKIKHDGSNEMLQMSAFITGTNNHTNTNKALIQQSSQVPALILSTNSHMKSVNHFSYLCFRAFHCCQCCWSSQAVPSYKQGGFLGERVLEFC